MPRELGLRRARVSGHCSNHNWWQKPLTVTVVVPQGVPVVVCNPGSISSLGPSIGARRKGKGGREEGGGELHVENVGAGAEQWEAGFSDCVELERELS